MASASVIGRATVVRGNVSGTGALDVLGQVEGDVTVTGDVVVSEGAVIQGNVSGAQLSVTGTVAGNLSGSEAVLLETGARVVGDISAPRIGIAEGALVRGRVETAGSPAPVARPQQQRAAAARPASGGIQSRFAAPARPAPKVEPRQISRPEVESPLRSVSAQKPAVVAPRTASAATAVPVPAPIPVPAPVMKAAAPPAVVEPPPVAEDKRDDAGSSQRGKKAAPPPPVAPAVAKGAKAHKKKAQGKK